MTRRRAGWLMVAAAAALLAIQVIPGIVSAAASAFAPRRSTSAAQSPQENDPARFVAYVVRRLHPAQDSLFIDREGGGRQFSLVGWNGEPAGSVMAPPAAQPQPGREPDPGQSPDGARFLSGSLLLGIDGRTTDLAAFATPADVSDFNWWDDSSGACALDATSTVLLEFIFDPNTTRLLRFPLPPDIAPASGSIPPVLSCSRVRRTAVLGLVGQDRIARVVVLDLGTGVEQEHRVYSNVGSLVLSPDGRLIGINPLPTPGGAGAPAQVRDLVSDDPLLRLNPGLEIRAFSGDDVALLASPASPAGHGASILRMGDGSTIWSDSSDRRLVGWRPRPYNHDFAVALGRLDLRTCTRGEPGKFPQFCRYQPQQDLEVVSGYTGAVTALGRGVAAWGYTLP